MVTETDSRGRPGPTCRGLKLYVAAPASDPDYPYQDVAANSDGIVLMNYDQHSPESEPGALAAQDWFVPNLKKVLKLVPSNKVISGIANYGYDWESQQQVTNGVTSRTPTGVYTVSVQEAWEGAKYSGAVVDFDRRTLNPHLSFVDEPNEQHDIWFTDAVTALNQMRASQSLGIDNFALWRLDRKTARSGRSGIIPSVPMPLTNYAAFHQGTTSITKALEKFSASRDRRRTGHVRLLSMPTADGSVGNNFSSFPRLTKQVSMALPMMMKWRLLLTMDLIRGGLLKYWTYSRKSMFRPHSLLLALTAYSTRLC